MNKNKNSHSSIDVYAIVTNRIIEHLEKGVVPWQKTWSEAGVPRNLISKKPYRGINVWLLSTLNHAQNIFLTFKQVKELGGSIKKGEKANEVVFWKTIEKENPKTKEIERKGLLRYYMVFNISQCTGIPESKLPEKVERNNNPIEECEKIINEMPNRPEIKHDEHSAYYHKGKDYVNMPKVETFISSEAYYGALFHELVHSSGHQNRLDRKEVTEKNAFGTDQYAIEELTAEMGASYLKSHAGIPMEKLENNAAYIQSWLTKLKQDRKFIVYASSQAQKATDYILNIKNEEKEIEVQQPEKTTEREMELEEMRAKRNTVLIER